MPSTTFTTSHQHVFYGTEAGPRHLLGMGNESSGSIGDRWPFRTGRLKAGGFHTTF